MFTKLFTASTIAAVALTAGLTASAHAAAQDRAAGNVALAQFCPPVIPQLPTFPQQPPLLVPIRPIEPLPTPTLPIYPAPRPRPHIAPPIACSIAFSGDDGGCVPPRSEKPGHPVPPTRPSCGELA